MSVGDFISLKGGLGLDGGGSAAAVFLGGDMIDLKIVLCVDDAKIPTKNDLDNGFDLYCCLDENFTLGYFDRKWGYEIEPLERYLFTTGMRIGFPEGYFGIIKDRSGLAVKNGITTLAGILDNGYTGIIKVCLFNTGNKSVIIHPGDRIAQMIIQKDNPAKFVQVDQLEDTARSSKSFGSSGR